MKQNSDTLQKNNVYLSNLAQDEWNDIRAYHIANEAAWRFIAVIAIITLMVVALYAIYAVNQDKHKTLIFEKDSLGNITTLGLATKTFNVDNKIIAHQLAGFIVALRDVPKDATIKRRNIDLVHKMINSKIRNQIDQLLITQYTVVQDKQIVVDISSIVPLEGAKSWSVHWFEDTINSSGVIINHQSFSSIITFTLANSVIPSVQLVNPIGLFVNYVHPVEDFHSANM